MVVTNPRSGGFEYWHLSDVVVCSGLYWGAWWYGSYRYSTLVAIADFISVSLLVLSPGAQLASIGIMAALAGAASMVLGTVLVKR